MTKVSLVILFGLFSCVLARTTQTIDRENATIVTNSTQSPPRNFDDIPGLAPAVLTCAVLTQLLLPFFLCCCRKSCKVRCVDANERQEQLRLEESGEKIDANLEIGENFCRLVSLYYYFSFFVWLGYLIAYNVHSWEKLGKVFYYLQIMAIVTMVFSTLVVYIESLISDEFDYLRNIMEDDTVWSYIEKMQTTPPSITMTAECYHYVTRTRHYSSGTHTSRDKVVTHTDEQMFLFGYCVDESQREMPSISRLALTRLKIDSYVAFGDEEIEQDYERMQNEMKEKNEHKDEHMKFTVRKEIPGLERRICAYVDLSVKPWWIRPRYYWIATLLMLTWPYRWLFNAKTAKGRYEVRKKIYKSTGPTPEGAVENMVPPPAVLQGNGLGASVEPLLTV